MIFVSVGNARDFSRLVKEMDEIAKDLKDEVIIQKGQTKYKPKNCKYFDFVSREEFSKFIKKSDIVITHGGVGTIINSLNFEKPTIVVPRRKKYNEHKNDHQMDITKELDKEKRVLACYDVRFLKRKIREIREIKLEKSKTEIQKIKKTLRKFIDNVNK